jgi:hypothetical protein
MKIKIRLGNKEVVVKKRKPFASKEKTIVSKKVYNRKNYRKMVN